MHPFALKLPVALISCLLCAALPCAGQTSCEVPVLSTIQTDHPDLSLADLLAPEACSLIAQAASTVHLGRSPVTGSVRVLEGTQVRGLFESLSRKLARRHLPALCFMFRSG